MSIFRHTRDVTDKPLAQGGRPSDPVPRDGSARRELSYHLRAWREARGKHPTQDEIASELGYSSRDTVRRLLRGDDKLATPEFVRLVIQLGGGSDAEIQAWVRYQEALAFYEQDPTSPMPQPPDIHPGPDSSVGRAEQKSSGPDRARVAAEPELATGAGAKDDRPDTDAEPATLTAVPASAAEPADDLRPPARQSSDPRKTPRRRRRSVVLFLSVAVLVVLIVVVWVVIRSMNTAPDDRSYPPGRQIVVQNMIAVGPSGLREDNTPAYLSSQPRPYCASANPSCEVADSQMQSRAVLYAYCVTTNETTPMMNYNEESETSKNNPFRARSSLWYKASMSNGASGYISEIYVQPAYRGGLGLPACRPD